MHADPSRDRPGPGRLTRRKEREAAGLFLAEGPQAVREALRAGAVTDLYVEPAASARLADLRTLALEAGVRVSPLAGRDLAALTDTVTPQGVVAVCRRVDVGLGQAVRPGAQLVVCCAQVRDPGNAGTVVRCADAFGADGVVLSTGSVELTNPKTVRASVGSLFHLPVSVGADLAEVVATARAAGLQVLAADGSGEDDLASLSSSGVLAAPTLWVFGNEAWGMPEQDRALADRVVRVPLYGAAESLNLATAAAVCLWTSASAQRAA
ncbi:RNA methyltransferase, TrmH family [Microlunatus sagamiharensis]|uniref:RNA methyltransferase, TrmH family n=1 Tax=Microlunatus sagamiharensis TaxID=546874 RepID=A0A1H2LXY6_9ACTN|nr:RNA methyltransferase [Microlunatus sagamiharensis]SDU85156.1 RNA methyltransferase, TrmH family [Microlunatus sagamiharensis]